MTTSKFTRLAMTRHQRVGRARWGSQVCDVGLRLEVHRVVKRGQGGSDFDLDHLVALCTPCHAQTDVPYLQGRLVITPLSEGRFTCEVTRGADKWAIRAYPRTVDGACSGCTTKPRSSG